MRTTRNVSWIALLLACAACTRPAAVEEGGCPYLPQFIELRPKLAGLPPAKAAAALQAYSATHENPQACEATEIDRLLGDLEKQLFVLVSGEQRLAAQVVFRCNQFDSQSARCDSPMADGTSHPLSFGIQPLPGPAGPNLQFQSEQPGAELIGIYQIALGDALDGKAATSLGNVSPVAVPASSQDSALIAIYRTTGPWRYRKVVWYF